MQQHPSAQLLRIQPDFPFVPDRRDEILVPDTAQLAFRAKGHQNFPFQMFVLPQLSIDAAFAEIEGEFPLPVQIFPVFSLQLGLRVFRSRNRIHLLSLLARAFLRTFFF